MLIQISYNRNDSKVLKYVNDFPNLNAFLNSYLEVNNADFEYIEIIFYRGEDEKRVREVIEVKEESAL
jgi:hypothetical protein